MPDDPNQLESESSSEPTERTNCQELQEQVTNLTQQIKQMQLVIDEKEKQVKTITTKLEKAKADFESLTKKAKELKAKKIELRKQLNKEQEQHRLASETATAKEEHLQTQIQGLFEQIDKLRSVLKERDSEIQQLQVEILAKSDAEAKVQSKPLRPAVSSQEPITQDTTVLRRRINDLEMELNHLKQALEKDPKYRIYLLVRETGQRTLEELSKVLGVGVFEARRRVQELVRGGLLTLKDEKVLLARLQK